MSKWLSANEMYPSKSAKSRGRCRREHSGQNMRILIARICRCVCCLHFLSALSANCILRQIMTWIRNHGLRYLPPKDHVPNASRIPKATVRLPSYRKSELAFVPVGSCHRSFHQQKVSFPERPCIGALSRKHN